MLIKSKRIFDIPQNYPDLIADIRSPPARVIYNTIAFVIVVSM